ncbi:PEP-CTERM-box response regulator transcription factor [Spiribacter vilamensis]|nr:PEP-CTERM-box response regulator transcription factor [Spiribacter vilamensis]
MIVEDDPGLQRQLRWCFDRYEILVAEDRPSAMAQLRRHEPAVVLQDLGLPPDPDGVSEGLATLNDIIDAAPHTKVIVVTGNGDATSAVRSVSLGAYDFYEKPVDTDTLNLIVARAFHLADLERQNRALMLARQTPLAGVLGASESMARIARTVEKVARTRATVLLQGETGTGKEVLARAIHRLSDRASESFVAINCAAIPENLLESELFGYERGAFTGAQNQTRGKIEMAEGGTLFLDEIGDMPVSLQSKLLRFLQERVLERVGGRREIPVDTRVVCATHQNLPGQIDSGNFRQDLYYRISEIVIDIPPLRARESDPLLLARHFLAAAAQQHGSAVRGLTDDAAEAVSAYEWPGNVRELEHRINRAVIMAEGKLITLEDLGLDHSGGERPSFSLREVRDRAEERAVREALARATDNVSKAADLLGVSRPTLYDLMRKFDLKC